MVIASTIKPYCILCNSETDLFYKDLTTSYYKCRNCFSVFMYPGCFPNPEKEKKRYELHNNDVNDIRYQNFVMPIINELTRKFNPRNTGLDFGAGTGPVITKLLSDKGYHMELYDPFFWNNPEKLNLKYDFIVCCEVIEHFHNPYHEFDLMQSILREEGMIFCMTEFYSEEIDFPNWYYKNDPTHVFFYHKKALEWIKKNFNFATLKIQGRMVLLGK